MVVADTTVAGTTTWPPNRHVAVADPAAVAARSNPDPVTVMTVPPPMAPVAGCSDSTTGSAK